MITKILSFLFDSIETKRKRDEELYLSRATDLVDLERRQKKLIYGNRNNFL